MKKIGLTGIIGSGKTTAALYFKGLGVPVFIADDCAKELMENDDKLKNQIINLLGDSAYLNGKLNKKKYRIKPLQRNLFHFKNV